MIYCRIKLSKTNYKAYDKSLIDDNPNLKQIQDIYKKYCDYKKFKSVQPLFANDIKVHKVMAYYDDGKFVAFSLLYELDKDWIHPVFKNDIKTLILSLPNRDIRSIKQI